MEQDPIEYRGGDNNLYRYELNRAVDVIDPSGLKVQLRCSGVGGAGSPAQHCGIIVSCNGKSVSYDGGGGLSSSSPGTRGTIRPKHNRDDPASHQQTETLYNSNR